MNRWGLWSAYVEVLHELMRDYIEKTRAETWPQPLISTEERRRRREAADYAHASVRLEGFVIDAETEAQTRKFINGEIDLAEFMSNQDESQTPTEQPKQHR